MEDFELLCNNAMTYNQKRSRVFKAAMTLLRAGKKTLQTAEAVGRAAIIALHPDGPAAALEDDKNHPMPEPTRHRKGSSDAGSSRRCLPPAGQLESIRTPVLGQQPGVNAFQVAQGTARGSAIASPLPFLRPESTSPAAESLVTDPALITTCFHTINSQTSTAKASTV